MSAPSYYNSVRADREEWRAEMPQKCMKCGARLWQRDVLGRSVLPLWLEIHEILSRAQAPKSWGFRANYLLLCNPCHQFDIPSMSHAAQLAIKKRADPKHYDLDEWLRVRNPNAMDYVTEAEVIEAGKAA